MPGTVTAGVAQAVIPPTKLGPRLRGDDGLAVLVSGLRKGLRHALA